MIMAAGFKPKTARVGLQALVANPFAPAAGAALLFLTALVATVFALGDPHGGAPLVRLPVRNPATLDLPPGWREAQTAGAPSGAAKVTEDVFALSAAPVSKIAAPARPFRPADALPKAPIAGLYSQGPQGPLPIVGKDGRTPAEAYARPFKSNGRPKIALVIGGLGLNAALTRQAIDGLPPEVTLAFTPYAQDLQGWIDQARARGHEVLLEAPMEPLDYPDNDPGPYTLLAQAQPAETVKKLEWLLSRATGYFGLTNYLGSRFLAAPNATAPFAGVMRSRGLAFLDDGSAPAAVAGGVQRASAQRTIDEQLSGPAIDRQLLTLEALSLQHGQTLGAGFAYPVTLAQVANWAKTVESRGYQLAPASAVTSRR
jgi:uncharacterized protein